MKKRVVKKTSKPVVSRKTGNISARVNEEAKRNRMAHSRNVIPEKISKIVQKRTNNNVPLKTNKPVQKPVKKSPIKKIKPKRFSRINFKVLAVSFLVVIITAGIGMFFTQDSVNSPWYGEIKPLYTPPNIVFPIAWTILFTLIALSLYLSWTNADQREKQEIAFVFAVNLILNAVWSFLFFFLQNPVFAFFEIIPMLFSILLMIFATYRINKIACYMLVPYFLWVSFATALNYLSAFA